MAGRNIESVALVGSNGGFGRLFAPAMADAGMDVFGVDLHPEPAEDAPVRRYAMSDIRDPSDEARELLAAASCVILALPEPVALAAVRPVAGLMRDGALLVDVLSVKTRICARLEAIVEPIERLSIHPMVRPSLGLEGRNVAVVEVAAGPLSAEFLALLEQWGARLTRLTAAQHDRLTAALQVATHAALLAFAGALRDLGYDAEEASSVATPLHSALLALVARVVTGDPGIYRDIQASHPFAAATRAMIGANAVALDDLVTRGGEEEFDALFAGFRELLGERLPRLVEESDAMFRLPAGEGAPASS